MRAKLTPAAGAKELTPGSWSGSASETWTWAPVSGTETWTWQPVNASGTWTWQLESASGNATWTWQPASESASVTSCWRGQQPENGCDGGELGSGCGCGGVAS